ncbi:hypothetical protein QTP70_000678 [Hemibagrus guttatus]|uniref:Uncharacterized protein n=1 Tax=Hemibagrus guttatus TaxID=175788 RepID=A0AAE0RC84_9TELE|nr:hypothetical protein QTP70_000678 [Hemibagrus guttatus]KAK3571281.1 hypothetical protein QTP86_005908 [Hemibagrus guttatus]
MAMDNRPIGKGYFTHQTIPFTLQVGLFHFEELSFFMISSPANPIILGFPWLQLHNPHMSWREGEITRWSPYCQNHCLKNTPALSCPSKARVTQRTPLSHENIMISEKYSARRGPLDPPSPWHCSIDLLSNAWPPKSSLSSRSF